MIRTATHRGRVMGSELVVVVTVDHHDPDDHDPDDHDPADLAASAHVFVSALEGWWSRFIDSSDISRLNMAGGSPVEVDDHTLTLLATMQAAHAVTGGAYDPSILPTMVANGYAASRLDPAMRTQLPAPVGDLADGADLADISLDPLAHLAQFPVGLCVDPGGIGKGLAADFAVQHLLEHGAVGALVSIGGDLVAAGRPPTDNGWVIAVERSDVDVDDGHGDDVPVLLTMAIDGGGVATSSTRSRRWVVDGRERHHLIDPRTRQQSATDLAGATVVAPTGWEAEAHATAALLAGSTGFVDYLRRHRLEGAAVTLDGMVMTTDRLAALVVPFED